MSNAKRLAAVQTLCRLKDNGAKAPIIKMGKRQLKS